MARPTTPAFIGSETIFGKMVTMSIFTLGPVSSLTRAAQPAAPSRSIEIDQPLWRLHHDAPRRHVDLETDAVDQRQHYVAVDHEVAAVDGPLDRRDASYQCVCGIANLAPDQIVPVIRPLRERRERLLRQPDVQPREPLRVLHRADARE